MHKPGSDLLIIVKFFNYDLSRGLNIQCRNLIQRIYSNDYRIIIVV